MQDSVASKRRDVLGVPVGAACASTEYRYCGKWRIRYNNFGPLGRLRRLCVCRVGIALQYVSDTRSVTRWSASQSDLGLGGPQPELPVGKEQFAANVDTSVAGFAYAARALP